MSRRRCWEPPVDDVDVRVARFVWRDGGDCDGKQALGVTVELRDNDDVDIYVGIPCSLGEQLFVSCRVPEFSR